MTEKLWTIDEVKANLATKDEWLVRGLLAIYDRQTEDEKVDEETRHYNGVGFNGFDAHFASEMVRHYRSSGRLTFGMLKATRRMMVKYCGQLVRIANKEI